MIPPDLQQSLTQALTLHRSGKLREAEAFFRRIIRDFPACADALHLLGVLAHQSGRSAEARDLLLQAIALSPADASFHSNLGTVFCSLHDFGAAAKAFAAALTLKPDLVETHCNLALVLLVQGKYRQAIESCKQALQVRPNCAEAHLAWADALHAQHQPADAAEHYQQAVVLAPDLPERHRRLVITLAGHGKFDQALAACQTLTRLTPLDATAQRHLGVLLQKNRQPQPALAALHRALELDPVSPETHLHLAVVLQENGALAAAAGHYRQALDLRPGWKEAQLGLATATGENTPASLPPDWIERLFDQYAPTYDEHITTSLRYQGAQQLLAAFRQLRPAAEKLCILDLGCGTGLCGLAFKPLASRLVGVDLSAGMIERAKNRGIYDLLQQADITNLPPELTAQFDLLVAGDVFLYLGDLAPALAAASRAMRPWAHLAFTLEATDGDSYRLQLNSRYAHSLPYIHKIAAAAGLTPVHQSPLTLRHEKGNPVPGHLIIVQRKD